MTKLQTRSMRAAAVRLDDAPDVPRPVAFYDCGQGSGLRGHDRQSKIALARSIADLLAVAYLGELDDARLAREPFFVVPSDTLASVEHARRLGIARPEHLFGGVVPHPFVATKVITHPLVRPDADAPEGWSADFAEAVRDVVLPGFSVFSADDARLAGERLLRDGAVRLKAAAGVGGAGQHVVRDLAELRAHVASIGADLLRRDGLVLERNLAEVTTHSVGQARVGRWIASYCGTQRLVRNHHGHEVYGGSCLSVVRGDYSALRGLALAPAQRLAVDQALAYHERALSCFAGLMASRSNYDVAQGVDDAGQARSGVLEQSWRIGGASGAEILALHAFRADPGRQVLRASTCEVYGDSAVIPVGAQLHFDGLDDARIGRLRKYAQVEHDGRA